VNRRTAFKDRHFLTACLDQCCDGSWSFHWGGVVLPSISKESKKYIYITEAAFRAMMSAVVRAPGEIIRVVLNNYGDALCAKLSHGFSERQLTAAWQFVASGVISATAEDRENIFAFIFTKNGKSIGYYAAFPCFKFAAAANWLTQGVKGDGSPFHKVIGAECRDLVQHHPTHLTETPPLRPVVELPNPSACPKLHDQTVCRGSVSMGDVSRFQRSRFVVAWILALVLLSTAAFITFSPPVEHIPAGFVASRALRGWRWGCRIFEPAGIPEVCLDIVLGKEKALTSRAIGSTTRSRQYTDVFTTKVGARIFLVDDDFVHASTGSISSPFHVLATLPYASIPLEPELRAKDGDLNQMQKEKERLLKEKGAAREERANEETKDEALQAAQEQPGMAMMTHRSSKGTSTQPTPARNPRKKLRRSLAPVTASLQPLQPSAQTYTDGAVQLWKAAPLVVSVDVESGKNSPSCIPSSSFTSTSTSTSCKTIRYALEHGQIDARKQTRPLELEIAPGVYLGECSDEGNVVTIATTIKKAGGRSGAVKIDCEKKGKAFNVTQTPNFTFHLEGLTIVNGKSAMGGAAFVEGGSMVLKGCTFDDLESLASSAEGNFVGGGAIMFVAAIQLHSEDCSFYNCRAASGSGGGILVSFHAVGREWAAVYALTILGGQFHRCGAGASGGAVAAVAEEGVASVAVLVDDTAFDGSWLYSADSVEGGHVYFSYSGDATNANTTIRGSNFTNGIFTGSNAVGGCYFEYSATVTKAYQQIKQCIFCNNTLIGSYATGGGVAVTMRYESTEMALTFFLCVFAYNVLRGDQYGAAYGAGVYIQLDDGIVRSMLLLAERSAFEGNVASASGAGGLAHGAGLMMAIFAEAMDMTSTITQCTFSSNTARAEEEGGETSGAAMYLYWGGATAGGLLTTILDSAFEANRADGRTQSAGAVNIIMQTTNPYTGAVRAVVNGCRFLDNAAAGGSGYGGAVYHGTLQAGASLHVLGCTIRRNNASYYGAGIYAEQTIPNPPANLMMDVTPLGPEYAVPYDCDPSFSAANGYARKYNYSSALVIDSCDISNNSAVSKDGAVKADGGALYALNTEVSIRSSTIAHNTAEGKGGGIALVGSASLTVEGNTSVKGNLATTGGTALDSSSAGSIEIRDEATVEFHADASAPGMAIVSGGKLEHGRDTVLQCPEGEQMVMNMSTTPTTFPSWAIDCNSVQSMDNGTRVEFENPTCKQLQRGNSPLTTYQCDGLPMTPAMLSTSGTISCVPCPNNQYSLEGAIMRGSKVHPIQCELCPYGGNCELGGARVRAKAGFWAVAPATATAPGSNIAPSTALKMLTCPQGYCCENRSSGCVWNSNDACQGNRRQHYPLCGGCQQGFSQAINGIGCVADGECGGTGFVVGYLLLQLLVVWAGSDLYALYAARYQPLISRLRPALRPAACNSGGVAVVIYFGQMAVIAAPERYNSLVSRVAGMVGEVSMLRQLTVTNQGSTCARAGMGMVHVLVWQLCLPFVLLALLPVVAMLARCLPSVARCACHRRSTVMRSTRGISDAGLGPTREPLILLKVYDEEAEECDDGLEEQQDRENDENEAAAGRGRGKGQQGLWGAVACQILFAFASFAESVLRLLNCVEVNDKDVLYYAGAVDCNVGGFRGFFVVLLLVLLLVPLSAVCWPVVPMPMKKKLQIFPEALQQHPAIQAFRRHATEPFKGECENWTAVLMLQR
jgi:hypothetical protein